jgi:hypothetical protein
MLTITKGDASNPIGQPGLILHVCNNIGVWGGGFTHALDLVDPNPRLAFKAISKEYRLHPELLLGQVQFVSYKNHYVANMFAQSGIRSKTNPTPIDYDALTNCLIKVNTFGADLPIYGPKFGSGLAGGDWLVISGMINRYLPRRFVTIYTLD